MEVLFEDGRQRRVDVDAAGELGASGLTTSGHVRISGMFSATARRRTVRQLTTGPPPVPSVAQPVLNCGVLTDGTVGTHIVIGLLEPQLR